MATQKHIINITDPEPEDRWTIQRYMYHDLKGHVEELRQEHPFWDGLQWCLAGGGLSSLISTTGYNLFETSPNGYALCVGYLIALSFFVISGLLLVRNRGETPSLVHHKNEILRILNHVQRENQREEISSSKEGLAFQRTEQSTLAVNLFTDLRRGNPLFTKENL